VPFIFFVLLVVLIAQLGFWKALGAVVGAFAMFGVLIALVIAVIVIGGFLIAGSMRRRI
jgi:hypothetical protein